MAVKWILNEQYHLQAILASSYLKEEGVEDFGSPKVCGVWPQFKDSGGT